MRVVRSADRQWLCGVPYQNQVGPVCTLALQEAYLRRVRVVDGLLLYLRTLGRVCALLPGVRHHAAMITGKATATVLGSAKHHAVQGDAQHPVSACTHGLLGRCVRVESREIKMFKTVAQHRSITACAHSRQGIARGTDSQVGLVFRLMPDGISRACTT